jgi:hypothetical protein
VQVDLAGTTLSHGRRDKQLFAIPGYIVFAFRWNLTDPFWLGADDIVTDALDKVGGRLINGAVQLRLAAPDVVLLGPG